MSTSRKVGTMKRRPVVGMVALAEHGQPAAVLPLEDALDADGVRSVRRWFGASSQERTVVGRFHSRTSRFPGRHDDQVDALTQGLAWGRYMWSHRVRLSRDAVCGTSGAGWRLTFTVEAIWGSILFMSPDSKPALSAPTGSKNDPKPGKNGNSGRPLFPKSHLPVFSLLFAFGKII